jgi:hypothetical protein
MRRTVGRRFEGITSVCQRVLASHAMIERCLQFGLEILGLHGAGVFLAARQFFNDTCQLLPRQLPVAGQLLQFVATLALRKLGLAQFAFSAVDLLALVAQHPLAVLELRPRACITVCSSLTC